MKAINAGPCLALIIYTFRVGFSQLGKHSGYKNKKSTNNNNNKGTYNNKEYKQGQTLRECARCVSGVNE